MSKSYAIGDEPTAALDHATGEAVMELLRELHRSGSTIVMVTHDPRFASYAARNIHLFDGRVVDESEQSSTAGTPPPSVGQQSTAGPR